MSQAKSADTTSPAAAVPTGGGSSRRALLTAAPAAAAGALLAGTAVNAAAVAMAKAGEVDPIFAVIAEHQAAFVAVVAAYAREDREGDDDEITEAAQQRVLEAGLDLFTTPPTTLAGVVALLEHLGTDATAYDPNLTIWEWSLGFEWEEVREFPWALADALRNIIARGRA
jgi:hypothetical protein